MHACSTPDVMGGGPQLNTPNTLVCTGKTILATEQIISELRTVYNLFINQKNLLLYYKPNSRSWGLKRLAVCFSNVMFYHISEFSLFSQDDSCYPSHRVHGISWVPNELFAQSCNTIFKLKYRVEKHVTFLFLLLASCIDFSC